MLTNGGSLAVYSGKGGAHGEGYGALVDVGGEMTVTSKSWVYPWSHPTNGGSVLFLTRDLTIPDTDGGFSAQGGGFAGARGKGAPATATSRYGGGYGGVGGGVGGGGTYGCSNAPALPGSGGGTYGTEEWRKFGGGLVRIVASGTMAIKGQIVADGALAGISYGGGGSGGGIFLTCETFKGSDSGLLQANGAMPSYGYGDGGGGRIAVWRRKDASPTPIRTDASGGATAGEEGGMGTVVWGWEPPQGTVILVR